MAGLEVERIISRLDVFILLPVRLKGVLSRDPSPTNINGEVAICSHADRVIEIELGYILKDLPQPRNRPRLIINILSGPEIIGT